MLRSATSAGRRDREPHLLHQQAQLHLHHESESIALNGTGDLTARAFVVTALGVTLAAPGDPSAPVGPRAAIDALGVLRALLALATGLFLAAAGWAVRRRRWARVSGLAALAVLFGVLCVGCGGSNGTAYAVTVTGTSTNSTHMRAPTWSSSSTAARLISCGGVIRSSAAPRLAKITHGQIRGRRPFVTLLLILQLLGVSPAQ